jgi:hypothetical protein
MKRKSKRFVLLLCVLALAGAVGLGLYRAAQQTDGSEEVPDGGIWAWTCPMHLKVIADKPGDCPICNMKLVPAQPAEPEK